MEDAENIDQPEWTPDLYGWQYPIIKSEKPGIDFEVDLLPEGTSIYFQDGEWLARPNMKAESTLSFHSPDLDEVIDLMNNYIGGLDTYVNNFM